MDAKPIYEMYLKPLEGIHIIDITPKNMIQERFNHFVNTPSDISEHLTTLYNYGKECDHITEMGVRDVVSTWAWLMAEPKKLVCYDIVKSNNIEEAIKECELNAKTEIKFIEADVLKVEIEETDLLFIDTLHTYSQLKQELALHAKKVKKYIIFHDTETYGQTPEPSHFKTHNGVVTQDEKVLANYIENDKGIRPAIDEFLIANPQWTIHAEFKHNNGLLIIKRG